MDERDRPEDDTEGHMPWGHVSPEGTEEENAEGQSKRRVSAESTEEDDTEGQALRPPPDHLQPSIPMIQEDDTEGQGMVGSPRPPVD